MPRPPLVLAAERAAKKPAWLNDVRRYHNRGDVNFDSCSELCFEQGDFFGLDDLFTEQPTVVQGLAEIHAGWIRRYKVDGFRVDTARHVNRDFFTLWVPQIQRGGARCGCPRLRALRRGLRHERGRPRSVTCATGGCRTCSTSRSRMPPSASPPVRSAPAGSRSRLEDDDYFLLPNGAAHTPPTFLGNHDMGRGAALIRTRAGVGGAAVAAPGPARPRPALPAARRAGRPLRRRGRPRRPRRRQGGAAGPLPDPGAGVADGGAGRRAADRDAVLLRRHQPPGRPRGCGRSARCATPIRPSRPARASSAAPQGASSR